MQSSEIKHVSYSLRQFTPNVSNQKLEPNCLPHSLTDMVQTTCSIHYGETIVLSPQALVDCGLNYVEQAIYVVTSPEMGLERIGITPFRRLRQVDSHYQTTERFTVDQVKSYDTPLSIKVALTTNFSEDGSRYPAIGVMRMGSRFLKRKVAARYAEEGKFYRELRPGYSELTREEADMIYGGQHAMLITGINTKSYDHDHHYVEVKNSYGYKWGRGGFSNVDFALFDYVLVPKLGDGPKTSYGKNP